MSGTLFDHLPEFEGRDPVGTELAMSGTAGRRTRPFRIGDHVVLVVEVVVTGVNHKETKGGIVRSHALKVEDAYELGGDRAPDLLESLHDEYEAYEDSLKGRQKLPGMGSDDEADAAESAAGAGPEARAEEREDLAALDEWAHSDEALAVHDTVDAAFAALDEWRAATTDDGWGDFDPEGDAEHVLLQGLRSWAQDAVAAGDYGDEDAALAALVDAFATLEEDEAEPVAAE